MSGMQPPGAGRNTIDPRVVSLYVLWLGLGRRLQKSGVKAFPGHGGTPIAGWFLLGKIPLKWRGTTIYGNPHVRNLEAS